MSQRSFSKRFAIIPPIRQPAVSDGFNLLNRSRPYPDHDQTFARGSAKAADLGLGVQPPKVGSNLGDEPASRWLLARAACPNPYTAPNDDSKERADDIKALTISEVNC
jgi:hypothetical protein